MGIHEPPTALTATMTDNSKRRIELKLKMQKLIGISVVMDAVTRIHCRGFAEHGLDLQLSDGAFKDYADGSLKTHHDGNVARGIVAEYRKLYVGSFIRCHQDWVEHKEMILSISNHLSEEAGRESSCRAFAATRGPPADFRGAKDADAGPMEAGTTSDDFLHQVSHGPTSFDIVSYLT